MRCVALRLIYSLDVIHAKATSPVFIVDTSAPMRCPVGGRQSGKARTKVPVAIMFACVQCLETGAGVQPFLVCALFATSATGSVSLFAMHSSGYSFCTRQLIAGSKNASLRAELLKYALPYLSILSVSDRRYFKRLVSFEFPSCRLSDGSYQNSQQWDCELVGPT